MTCTALAAAGSRHRLPSVCERAEKRLRGLGFRQQPLPEVPCLAKVRVIHTVIPSYHVGMEAAAPECHLRLTLEWDETGQTLQIRGPVQGKFPVLIQRWTISSVKPNALLLMLCCRNRMGRIALRSPVMSIATFFDFTVSARHEPVVVPPATLPQNNAASIWYALNDKGPMPRFGWNCERLMHAAKLQNCNNS